MRLHTLRMLLWSTLLAPSPAFCAGSEGGGAADDSRALLALLVRKGVLTAREAEELRAESRTAAALPAAPSASLAPARISLGLRLQVQQSYFSVAGVARSRTESGQGSLRRAYLTLAAAAGEPWSVVVTYDLASASFDEGVVRWRPAATAAFDFGLRKVETIHEEQSSSGDLRAIERSGVTRFFVESDNGRRLGAAGYRLGAFAAGPLARAAGGAVTWNAAVTNRDRIDTAAEAAGTSGELGRGGALWGGLVWERRGPEPRLLQAGIGLGWMPAVSADAARGWRPEITLATGHWEWRGPGWGLLAEVMGAEVRDGKGARGPARPRGGFFQSGFAVGGSRELVFRFSWLDAGGRGLQLSDVIRSAPAQSAFDRFTEGYAGLNWYLRGNDLKLQLGGIWARVHGDPAGRGGEERLVGGRSQLQVQF